MSDMTSPSPSVNPKRSAGVRRYFKGLSRDLKNKLNVHTRSGSQSGPSASSSRSRSPSLPSSSFGFNNKTWRGLEGTLRALHRSTELVPPLHSAIGGLVSFLGIFEEAARRKQDYEKLAMDLDLTAEFLRRHLQATGASQVTDVILVIIQAIEQELNSITKQQGGSMPSQMLGALHNEEDLLRGYHRIAQLLHRLQIEVSMSSWIIANASQVDARLEKLGPARLAAYNSMLSTDINRRTCTENTRQAILSELNYWSDNPDGEKICWMNGMAGTGKTTIACTLSATLEARGQLAASFFCTRTSPECRDPNRIVPTIAYQLARHSTPFQSALCQALEKDPDIGSRNISTQFERLLKEPLLEVKEKLSNNLVVVIDALDECDDGRVVELVLDMLFRSTQQFPLKFFVTSRPEPAIRNKMISQDTGLRSILYLHEIEQSLVQADIELYLHEELTFMSPSPDQVKQLAGQAGNLFIYAATAVRYIRPGKTGVDHHERLTTMLAVDSKSQKKFAQIDTLYSTILAVALHDDDLEPEERYRMRLVLWTTVCAQEPITFKTLAVLAGLKDERQAITALQPLRSVLHISEHNNLVATLHASFPDYIFSQDRSGEFFCNENEHSRLLAHRCFGLMKGQLRFNICELKSSFVPDKNVISLKEQIEKNISQELSYACRYWADHLKPTATSADLREMVEEFLSQRLLFWMEVLNLKECMAMGVTELVKVQQWLAFANASSDLLKLAGDAHIFVASFTAQAISISTPHIYISALSLSPESSSVSKYYRPRIQGLMKVNGTAMMRMRQAALATWTFDQPIESAAYSPDGTKIAFGTTDGLIYVQNAQDGKMVVEPFQGHDSWVTSVAFSPDGAHIVTGSEDRTIRVWNTYDGTLAAGPFKGHTSWVYSVDFSPDGTRIVSGSWDHTIRVWDARDGTLVVKPFNGHTDCVTSVGFSPDGMRILSGSYDRTIRVWNVHDGTLAAGPFEGHTGAVTSVAFSPDGAHIVSASNDHTIRMWNVYDGTPIASSFEGHTQGVTAARFSPDGARIVSGSGDRTIWVWAAQDGKPVAGPLEGHTRSVRSVSFSPDGTRILSSSDDCTIRVWNVDEGSPVAGPFQGHTYSVRSVAFSPDGTRIISGADDYTIRVWNAHNGALLSGPFKGHTNEVVSVRFSPDGTRIVSGSNDETIRIWDAQDGSLIAGPLHGHTHVVTSVAFSPDGLRIVSGSGDCTIRVWNSHDGKLVVGPLKGHAEWITSVTFSPDGTRIVSGSGDRTIRLWNVHDGTPAVRPFEGHNHWVTSVGFSPDGARIVSSSFDQTIRIWSVRDGTPIAKLFGEKASRFTSVVFSHDGTRIVSGSEDGMIQVWDADDGTLVAGPFRGHRGEITSVSFSPDSTRIASSSVDRTIRIWGTQSPNQVHASLVGPWTVRNDGWFVNRNSELLFWVPAEIRDYYPTINNVFTLGHLGAIQVDYSDVVLGEHWNKYYSGA